VSARGSSSCTKTGKGPEHKKENEALPWGGGERGANRGEKEGRRKEVFVHANLRLERPGGKLATGEAPAAQKMDAGR